MKNKNSNTVLILFSCMLFVLIGASCIRPMATNLVRDAYIGSAFSFRINDAIALACPEMEIDKAIELQELVEKHSQLSKVVHQYLCAYADWLQGDRDAVYDVDNEKAFKKLNREIVFETKRRNPASELAIGEEKFLAEISQAEAEVEDILQNQIPYYLQNYGRPAITAIKIYQVSTCIWVYVVLLLIMALLVSPVCVKYTRNYFCSLGKALLLQGCFWTVALPVFIKLTDRILLRLVDRILGRSMFIETAPMMWRGGILIVLGILLIILSRKLSSVTLRNVLSDNTEMKRSNSVTHMSAKIGLGIFAAILILIVVFCGSYVYMKTYKNPAYDVTVSPDSSGEQSVNERSELVEEYTEAELVGNGEIEGAEAITESEKNKNSALLYAKYSEVLMQILTDRADPNGRHFDDGSQGVDFSKNCFAVTDIDGDGRDELIFNFNDTYMAAMQEIVYDYDEKTDILQTELETFFIMNTYYSNGYVKADASHNHTCDPETRGIWPYSLYEYDAETDSYINIGYVECWDELMFPANYEGEAFPGELDADGDNLLFLVGYFTNKADNVERTYMDRKEFEAWEQTMFPDEYKIDIEYHPMAEEEITQLTGVKSQNNVNGLEFAFSNTNGELEDIEKIKEYMIPEQSFDISLNDWGEVTFVSCMPIRGSGALADVSFYLLSDGQIVYRFPYVNVREDDTYKREDNIRQWGWVDGISFVTFTDVNGDGKNDVVIGILYETGAGPQGTIPRMEVRIYEDQGDEFVYNAELSDEYDGLPYDTTAEEVKAMLKK